MATLRGAPADVTADPGAAPTLLGHSLAEAGGARHSDSAGMSYLYLYVVHRIVD
jgi:hypothetical protein